MEVVYYQLVIVFSIVITFATFGKRIMLFLSIFWTFFTALNLFYPPLIIIQLASIWGTFFIIKKWFGQLQELRELRKILAAFPAIRADLLLDYKNGENDITRIDGKNHKSELILALNESKNKLIIISGFISKYVISRDKKFLPMLEDCLSRGVIVYLGYGEWPSYEENEARRSLIQLKELKERFPNLLIKKFHNHTKLLIKDSDYMICGSFNWLSNNKVKRDELSFKFTNQPAIMTETSIIMELFEE